MANNSSIEWTEATWNPIVGCSILSPGCIHCYAMPEAARQIRCAKGLGRETHYEGTVEIVKGKPVWTGKLAMAPDSILRAPLNRKKPTTYFVNSMGDLFHEDCPDEWILRVLDVIRRCSYDGGSNIGKIGNGVGEHTFQVLTKRAARMASLMPRLRFNQKAGLSECALYLADDGARPLVMKNLWLGVSTERQQEADERREPLRALAAQGWTTFASYEPALGPINWSGWEFLRWLISGGESGPNARPSHPEWHQGARDFCARYGIAFFFKQWGEWIGVPDLRRLPGGAGPGFGKYDAAPYDQEHEAVRVGKAKAGRLLDGVLHDAMPERARGAGCER